MHSDEHTRFPHLSKDLSRGFSKYLVGGFIATGIILVGLSAGAFVYAQKYDGVIAPNVHVGSLNVGRKTPEQARMLLEKQTDDLLTHGIDVRLNGETKNIALSTIIGTDAIEYVTFDLDETLQRAESLRHHQNPFLNTVNILYALLRPSHTSVIFSVREAELDAALHTLFVEKEQLATETTFVIEPTENAWNVTVKPGVSGDQVDDATFQKLLANAMAELNSGSIELVKTERRPSISEESANAAIPTVQAILNAAPYHVVYTHTDGKEDVWKLDAKTLATLLVPTKDGTVSLDDTAFQTFLQPIVKSINVPAQNARFEIKSERAVKFAESKDGISVDTKKLFDDTLTQITQGSTHPIAITTVIETSTVKTADVNNIGITEVLGYGTSSYKGSPKNRRLNIQNGVNLLNGLLIAPGETFSLLQALKPFTIENGYLRELVIKGTKITPDVGGGLCQIGTTTFRAAMHAGLPIVERQNHSLVVSYYNDPANKNPGTDATIFEPAPDFKFTNNTEHYILFQAENFPEKSELKFSFWGTSDGRKGSYTPPKVSRWIPYGDPVIQTTTSLKPGEEKCQEAHIGADASFTYMIENPDGTKTEKVFSSHYRPLPQICLIGVEEKPEVIEASPAKEPAP